jgi:hypothetical protein
MTKTKHISCYVPIYGILMAFKRFILPPPRLSKTLKNRNDAAIYSGVTPYKTTNNTIYEDNEFLDSLPRTYLINYRNHLSPIILSSVSPNFTGENGISSISRFRRAFTKNYMEGIA